MPCGPGQRAALVVAAIAGLLLGACDTGHAQLTPAMEQGGAPAEPGGGTSVLARALRLALVDHPQLDEAGVRAEITRLADRWRILLPPEASAAQRADTFARLLFDDQGFAAVSDLDSAETLHIDSVLASRRGYCLSLSVVALAIAEALGEPLHGVALPNHFLVAWDDGHTRRHLELTRRGRVVDEAQLLAPLGPFADPAGAYGRDLSDAEVEAVLLHNRAFVASAAGEHERALADLARAEASLPTLGEIFRTRGVVLGELERWEPAIAALEQALRLFPLDVDALVNLALCRQASGDLPGALDELELALLLDPERQRARELADHWRADALYASGAVRALDDPPADLRPGLLGHYHAGRHFERELATRVDRDLDFDWQRGRPAPGLPGDDFSVRWQGWLRAPRTGLYTFYVVGNDGVRIRVGEQLALEHWRDTGYTSWTDTGSLELVAGWHPLLVEYYERSDNARFVCLMSLAGEEYPLTVAELLFHEAP